MLNGYKQHAKMISRGLLLLFHQDKDEILPEDFYILI
jgi:hypothetical protein